MSTPKHPNRSTRESVCRVHLFKEAFDLLVTTKPHDLTLTKHLNAVVIAYQSTITKQGTNT